MRSLTYEEQAFLAWLAVEVLDKKESFLSFEDAIKDWEELTGLELGPDFVEFVKSIHEDQ